MSTLAVFIALGGASYAAVTLPKNSVGTKQIKNGQVKHADLGKNSVTSSNVKNGSLLSADFAAGQLQPGPKGDTGLQGPKGDTGAKGDKGDAGLSATSTLPSGQTETGAWGMGVVAAAIGDGYRAVTQFSVPLAAAIPAANRHVIISPATTTACPGPGSAAVGQLCVYVQDKLNANNPSDGNVFQPEVSGGPGGASPHGFAIFLSAPAAGDSFIAGSFAVTAP